MSKYRLRYATQSAAAEYASSFETNFSPGELKARTLSLFEKRALRHSLEQIGGIRSALELPIGTGRMTPTIASRTGRIIGGDVSAAMLDVARNALTVGKSVPRREGILDLMLMDAESIPLPDRSIDVAICHGLFHQLPDAERLPMLVELRRVVRRSVVASFAITGGLLAVRASLRSRLLKGKTGPLQAAPHPLSLSELHDLLSEAGLRLTGKRWTARYVSCQLIVVAEPAK